MADTNQPPATLSKQRQSFRRLTIDLSTPTPVPAGLFEEYFGHESRATRAVGDSTRFLTVRISPNSRNTHIEDYIRAADPIRDDKLGVEYAFLGFTENNVKNGHLLFFREGRDWTVASLKNYFGAELRRVYENSGYGKYAARLGLSFSSTVSTFEVLPHEVHRALADLRADDQSVTSDGSGLIRDAFARQIIAHLSLPEDTTVFQFRHGGVKGTLTRLPDADFDHQCGVLGRKVAYRPTLIKYEGGPHMFEVHSISRSPATARLNKQFIFLLLTRGIRLQVFIDLLEAQLDTIRAISTNRERAIDYIDGELDSEGEGIGYYQELYEMLLAGHDLNEPYLATLLHRYQKGAYDGLRNKLNIIAPRSYYLLGIVDPYGVLEDGEVYVNLPTRGGPQVGALAFLRNPAYDADGIVVLQGVNKPRLSQLVNTIVFAARGRTSQTARMGGGDLDGDLYFVTTNPLLVPPHRRALPPHPLVLPRPQIDTITIGNHPAQTVGPGTPGTRQSAADMARDAAKTFTDHRNNFFLGALAKDFMKRVGMTPMLADSPACRELLAMILACLDSLKQDTSIAALRQAHAEFRRRNGDDEDAPYLGPADPAPAPALGNQHQNPLDLLLQRIPSLPTRGMEDFRIDPDLDLSEDAEADAMRRYAERLMLRYNADLQTAIQADDDAKAMRFQVDERYADAFKNEFFEREFPPLQRASIRLDFGRYVLKASMFYVVGYRAGKQSFAWVGGRYVNWLKATLTGRRPPMVVGPRSRPLLPQPIAAGAAEAPPPPAPPVPPAAPPPVPPGGAPLPPASVASSRRTRRAAGPSDDDDAGSPPPPRPRDWDQNHPQSNRVREWLTASASEYRADATPPPSVGARSPPPSITGSLSEIAISISGGAPSIIASPSVYSISTHAASESTTTTTRIRRVPLPESVPTTPRSNTTRRALDSPQGTSVAADSVSTASTTTRIRRVPLPNSVPSTPRSNTSRPALDSPQRTPRHRPNPIQRTNSQDTDVSDDYDVINRSSADEAEELEAARAAYASPPRRVVREETDKTLVDAISPDDNDKALGLLSPMSEPLDVFGSSRVMSPTRPHSPYVGYQSLLLRSPQPGPVASTSTSARRLERAQSHSAIEAAAWHSTYPPQPVTRAATLPQIPASPGPSAVGSIASASSSPSKHNHAYKLQANGARVCRCGKLYSDKHKRAEN